MGTVTYFSAALDATPTVQAYHTPARTIDDQVTVPEYLTVIVHTGDATVAIQGDPDLVRHTMADALAAVTETIAEARS